MWQIDLFAKRDAQATKVYCLFHTDCQVEKNLSLEDQLLHALQQSEDYRVRIDNYQSLIQYVFASLCKLLLFKVPYYAFSGYYLSCSV